jgi:hypothetical protein
MMAARLGLNPFDNCSLKSTVTFDLTAQSVFICIFVKSSSPWVNPLFEPESAGDAKSSL